MKRFGALRDGQGLGPSRKLFKTPWLNIRTSSPRLWGIKRTNEGLRKNGTYRTKYPSYYTFKGSCEANLIRTCANDSNLRAVNRRKGYARWKLAVITGVLLAVMPTSPAHPDDSFDWNAADKALRQLNVPNIDPKKTTDTIIGIEENIEAIQRQAEAEKRDQFLSEETLEWRRIMRGQDQRMVEVIKLMEKDARLTRIARFIRLGSRVLSLAAVGSEAINKSAAANAKKLSGAQEGTRAFEAIQGSCNKDGCKWVEFRAIYDSKPNTATSQTDEWADLMQTLGDTVSGFKRLGSGNKSGPSVEQINEGWQLPEGVVCDDSFRSCLPLYQQDLDWKEHSISPSLLPDPLETSGTAMPLNNEPYYGSADKEALSTLIRRFVSEGTKWLPYVAPINQGLDGTAGRDTIAGAPKPRAQSPVQGRINVIPLVKELGKGLTWVKSFATKMGRKVFFRYYLRKSLPATREEMRRRYMAGEPLKWLKKSYWIEHCKVHCKNLGIGSSKITEYRGQALKLATSGKKKIRLKRPEDGATMLIDHSNGNIIILDKRGYLMNFFKAKRDYIKKRLGDKRYNRIPDGLFDQRLLPAQ